MTILNWILLGVLIACTCGVFGICAWIRSVTKNQDGLGGISEGAKDDSITIEMD